MIGRTHPFNLFTTKGFWDAKGFLDLFKQFEFEVRILKSFLDGLMGRWGLYGFFLFNKHWFKVYFLFLDSRGYPDQLACTSTNLMSSEVNDYVSLQWLWGLWDSNWWPLRSKLKVWLVDLHLSRFIYLFFLDIIGGGDQDMVLINGFILVFES